MDSARRLSAVADGPAPRVPERVSEGMLLRGRRVIVADHRGEFVGDLRATDDPYWRDEGAEYEARSRWLPGHPPPAGCDQSRARLFVAVCTEPAWYEWSRTKRRPEVREYPAYLVWTE